MSSVTGIDIGPDYCVLVQARLRADTIQFGPVRVFAPGRWPKQVAARTALLAEARRELGCAARLGGRLAARCFRRSIRHAGQAERFEQMLRESGFEPEVVLTPPQALALLGGTRDPQPGTAESALYLSVNHQGAALVVVRGFETLYSREFTWRIAAPAQRTQAHLLRRYLMVAQLTPEVRRAVEAVRTQDRGCRRFGRHQRDDSGRAQPDDAAHRRAQYGVRDAGFTGRDRRVRRIFRRRRRVGARDSARVGVSGGGRIAGS